MQPDTKGNNSKLIGLSIGNFVYYLIINDSLFVRLTKRPGLLAGWQSLIQCLNQAAGAPCIWVLAGSWLTLTRLAGFNREVVERGRGTAHSTADTCKHLTGLVQRGSASDSGILTDLLLMILWKMTVRLEIGKFLWAPRNSQRVTGLWTLALVL